MKTLSLFPVSAIGVLTWLGVSGMAAGQTLYPLKLNGPLVAGGSVDDSYEISPSGGRVVYLADEATDEVNELYSVPDNGGVPVKLNGSLVANGDVFSGFKFTPNGSRVVYMADQDTSAQDELYSVPAAGGAAVKLNGALVINGDVIEFLISSDGSQVVYRAAQDVLGVLEIYSVPVAGGAEVKLNGPLGADRDVIAFQISPDASRVVFRADVDTDQVYELYSVPIGGGAPVKLNDPLAVGGTVTTFRFSPDGSTVVYRAEQDTSGVSEIYRVPAAGGMPVKLNGMLVAGGNVAPGGIEISPDSSRVVYRADQDTDGMDELYSVPIGGGVAVKLNSPLVANGNVSSDFRFSPDGSRVVFRGDVDTNAVIELYSVPAAGGVSTKLNVSLGLGRNVDSFQISSDSSIVAYVADQETNDVTELYSVPVAGGVPVKLNGPLVSGGDVDSYHISSDVSQVAYLADEITDGVNELFSVSVTDGSGTKLNDLLVSDGSVSSFTIHPGGSRVVYRADRDTDEVFELFVGKGQAVWVTSGGDWFATGNWQDGVLPGILLEAVIAVPTVVRLDTAPTPAVAESLYLGGASGPSVLDLSGGAVLNLRNGAKIVSGGALSGDGVVSVGTLTIAFPAGAELRAGEGEHFTLLSGAVGNAGRIEVLGVSSLPSEVEFAGPVTNVAGTGAIVGNDATLRFPQGLVNNGSMSFGAGVSNVLGDVDNNAGGVVIVTGGATALFWEDLTNLGVVNVSAAGALQSTAVFFGALSGNGSSGGGHVFIEGDARPGFSAGVMEFGGDTSFGPLAVLETELGGPVPGTDYDRLAVAGHLSLDGTLEVTLINGFVPAAGMVFDVWDAGSVSGAFTTLNLPSLPAGLFWHSLDVNTTGELGVGLTPACYSEFATHYGLTTPLDGDEDGDGLQNIFEYFGGSDPTTQEFSTSPLTIHRLETNDKVTFTSVQPVGKDLIVVLETSTTLLNGGATGWTVIGTRTGNDPWTGTVSVGAAPVRGGLVEVTLTNSSVVNPRRFYRLGVSLAP